MFDNQEKKISFLKGKIKAEVVLTVNATLKQIQP